LFFPHLPTFLRLKKYREINEQKHKSFLSLFILRLGRSVYLDWLQHDRI
jgi:hypothetical protein